MDNQPGGGEDRAEHLKRLVIANDRLSTAGEARTESTALEIPRNVPLQSDTRVLERADAMLDAPAAAAKERGDKPDFDAARELLRRHAAPALHKLKQNDLGLSANETSALEALIIADGTRPSFVLTDGKPDLADPTMGTWSDMVAAHLPEMQKLARATGRIQPAGGSNSRYIGTGTLVDAGAMLVLTNYHVIDDANTDYGVAMTRSDRRIQVTGDLFIDFLAEASSLDQQLFRIVEVLLPVGFGRGFGVIDAAVARIEPVSPAMPLQAAAPKLSRQASYANGGMASLATIGFPGFPPQTSGVDGDVDWGFVTKTLFHNLFGVKRLAPGLFTSARGTNPRDTQRTAFGHDATTFGGASGSLVTAWADEDAPGFGLHFVGATGRENNALSLAVAADALATIGVPFA